MTEKQVNIVNFPGITIFQTTGNNKLSNGGQEIVNSQVDYNIVQNDISITRSNTPGTAFPTIPPSQVEKHDYTEKRYNGTFSQTISGNTIKQTLSGAKIDGAGSVGMSFTWK